MEAKAVARFVHTSPTKLRRIADVVRGKPVPQALATLAYLPGTSARSVSKVVQSAAANADDRFGLELDELYVAEISIDGAGRTRNTKHWRPGARGRYKMMRRRSSHIQVVVREVYE
ncbi:MAG: 50S ribosomal protein L22 [Chloroflexi bacterium]|nr:50S ribosomal protein L22 [Chloroflexota bacterium]MBU1750914.1 50S ribosomal protein L22 [Chloroflexota bacterium]MBU1878174.1 50S ribosomal protein L22 [Chloroflexota bacterium]